MGYIHDVGAEENRGQDVVRHSGPKQDHTVPPRNAQGERSHNQRASFTTGIEVIFYMCRILAQSPNIFAP